MMSYSRSLLVKLMCLTILAEPHVSPIVRGKTDANVEFGAKISVSMMNGFAMLDRLSWDAYHEAAHLQGPLKPIKDAMVFIRKQSWPIRFTEQGKTGNTANTVASG